jgi:HSP20 family protein
MKYEPTIRNDELTLNPFFEDFFAPEGESHLLRGLTMKTDIKEEGNNYVIEVDLPGVEKKDIFVSFEEGYLTIKAKVDRDTNEKDKKGNYLHRERFSGVASRSYYVGNINEKTIDAAYTNGVLILTFPKEEMKKVENQHSIVVK